MCRLSPTPVRAVRSWAVPWAAPADTSVESSPGPVCHGTSSKPTRSRARGMYNSSSMWTCFRCAVHLTLPLWRRRAWKCATETFLCWVPIVRGLIWQVTRRCKLSTDGHGSRGPSDLPETGASRRSLSLIFLRRTIQVSDWVGIWRSMKCLSVLVFVS